jgi:MYXO-CTERM domain-containing protein
MIASRWLVAGLVLASAPAYALKPGTHADVANASCRAAGLGRDTCTRIATEDYNTDEREWDDLRAHAQIDDGETACVAADRAAQRLYQLGTDLRAAIAKLAASSTTDNAAAVDSLVGRALHTIQDNCAHHGMPNPQHAWFSLGDFCDGTETSPDLQPDGIACAKTESNALMQVVAQSIVAARMGSRLDGWSCPPAPDNGDHGNQQQAVCQGRFLPGPFDACDFLGRAKDWDGTDRRWNNTVVSPALQAAFAAGLHGGAMPEPMCHGDESVLSQAVSAPIVDVSGGAPSCAKASVFCLGKADDSENPFADDPTPDSSGCRVANDPSALFGLGLALVALRRRRR